MKLDLKSKISFIGRGGDDAQLWLMVNFDEGVLIEGDPGTHARAKADAQQGRILD